MSPGYGPGKEPLLYPAILEASVRLGLTTLRLTVACSTDWATFPKSKTSDSNGSSRPQTERASITPRSRNHMKRPPERTFFAFRRSFFFPLFASSTALSSPGRESLRNQGEPSKPIWFAREVAVESRHEIHEIADSDNKRCGLAERLCGHVRVCENRAGHLCGLLSFFSFS